MSELILKLFLYQSHIGKYNSFKLAAFSLEFSSILINNENTNVK